MIRALVADDSPTARALLSGLLGSDEEIEVVGEARNGADAVALVKRLRPDVVTMDIQMPQLDGFEATKRIMTEAPTPIVIVSGLDVRDVAVSLEALRVGALAVLPKPGGAAPETFEDESRHFVHTVKAMARVKIVRRWSGGPPEPVELAPAASVRQGSTPPKAVGVVASTGGPAALHRILSELGPDFPAPILVVQHIAIGFAEGLAAWLDGASKLSVKVASQSERLEPGTVYVAPDNRHLGVGRDGTVLLSDSPPVGGFRPSGTFLFESLAQAFGAAAAGVVLTGMGRDGIDGLRAIRAAGGTVVTQDEATSDVAALPAAAIAEGLADHVVPLSALARRLAALARTGLLGG